MQRALTIDKPSLNFPPSQRVKPESLILLGGLKNFPFLNSSEAFVLHLRATAGVAGFGAGGGRRAPPMARSTRRPLRR